jgi:aconitate hydratase
VELERQASLTLSKEKRELSPSLIEAIAKINAHPQAKEMSADDIILKTGIGTVIFAVKPGDGSAREQAASCQKVLGGWANIAYEYATKRYRSNLINWGMIPFTMDRSADFKLNVGDFLWIPGIRIINSDGIKRIELYLTNLTKDEREIILEGSLINYYGAQ